MIKEQGIKEKITGLIGEALQGLSIETGELSLEHPAELSHGDFSTNVAMKAYGPISKGSVLGEKGSTWTVWPPNLKGSPRELAEKITAELEKNKPVEIEKIEVAGAGFINFYLSREFFANQTKQIVEDESFGKNDSLAGEKAIVEYTDPNPFKEFHIGHLMSNTIGEAISRLVQWNGAEVKRACYQGDVGLHVAKAVWVMLQMPAGTVLSAKELGQAYAKGSKAYEESPEAKREIEEINKKIYDETDDTINRAYKEGRQTSLNYFETMYKKLGTKFDYYFFESTAGDFGQEIIRESLEKGIFEESEGAVVFHGEKYDPALHTRVFINSQGLPTYEAKELGLAKIKYDTYPYTHSIVVTGNEINEYFKVLLQAMSLVFPELAKKTKHLSHGMLRLPSGKMSSRTGDVITGESLLEEISEKVADKVKESERGELEPDTIRKVAVAALKYSILRQAIGKDIIFDFDKSVSFEGDSGPYLQYSYARAKSVIAKAKEEKIKAESKNIPQEVSEVEKLLYRFPEVVALALKDYSPQHIATYLIELARAFNGYYAETKIVDSTDSTSGYKVQLAEAFATVIKNGLTILGIEAPERM